MSLTKFQMQARLIEEEYQLTKELQNLFERREQLDLGWREFRPEGEVVKVVVPDFPQFARLPIELRTIIWEHTIVPRVQKFTLNVPRDPPFDPNDTEKTWSMSGFRYKAPISQVCCESRKIFLRNYIAFGNLVGETKVPQFYMNPTDIWSFNTIQLDTQQDSPLDEILRILEILVKFSCQPDFIRKIKTLALSAKTWQNFWYNDQEWEVLGMFPRVEEVIFVENSVDVWNIAGQNEYITEFCHNHRRNFKERPADMDTRVYYDHQYHDCPLNTGLHGAQPTFLAPFHEGELLAWERTMSMVGCVKAISPSKRWNNIKVSVARLVSGAELERKGPLVDFQGVRFGPPNAHEDWLQWKASQDEEGEGSGEIAQ